MGSSRVELGSIRSTTPFAVIGRSGKTGRPFCLLGLIIWCKFVYYYLLFYLSIILKLLFGYDLVLVKRRQHTSLHPDYKSLIQFAFKAGGMKFYEFHNNLDMPALRYKRLDEFQREFSLGVTKEDLLDDTKIKK